MTAPGELDPIVKDLIATLKKQGVTLADYAGVGDHVEQCDGAWPTVGEAIADPLEHNNYTDGTLRTYGTGWTPAPGAVR